MNRPSPRRKRGFTLIEVLLVLVILVVLASLAVVSYGPIQRRAKIQTATVQVDLIAGALDTYQITIGSYPSSLQALRTRPADLPDPDKWESPFLTKDISSDPWGKPYQYACPGNHNPDRFDVWTVTPENQEIGNWTAEKTK